MSPKKPEPVIAPPKPKLCPICHKSTYSVGGIHPQCAMQQAEAPRLARLAAERRAQAERDDAAKAPPEAKKFNQKVAGKLHSVGQTLQRSANFFFLAPIAT